MSDATKPTRRPSPRGVSDDRAGSRAVPLKPPRKRRRRAAGPSASGCSSSSLIWMIPTIGLLVSSFRDSDDPRSGWWTVFTGGGFNATLDNYTTVLERRAWARRSSTRSRSPSRRP
jgi:alpha-glucoside transport system permease protein